MKQCHVCGGIAVLREDGLHCYWCGETVEDPQTRLTVWSNPEVNENGNC